MSKSQGAELNEITKKYIDILKSNGIHDEVSQVTIQGSGAKGDGMMSDVQCVTVKFVKDDVEDLHLFVKALPTNPSHLEMVQNSFVFDKEALFLTKYVEAAKEFCKSKGMEGFVNFYPKCYFADDTIIVMEDLKLGKGYTLLNKEERQDLEAATFAMKTLAKHDALSYAMIQENGGAKKFLERYPHLDFECLLEPITLDLMKNAIDNAVQSNIRILEKSPVSGADEALSILRSFKKNEQHRLSMGALKCEAEKEKILILGHGDYWNNNMMFLKDPTTGKIIDHMAIDLQMTRYAVPGIELGFYFFSSVKMDVRQLYLQDLLKLYLDTFIELTGKMGYPVKLTHEELFTQFRERVDYGFWVAFSFTVGPGMAVFKEVDVDKIDISEWAGVFDKHIQNWVNEHPEAVKDLAEHLVTLIHEYDKLRLKK